MAKTEIIHVAVEPDTRKRLTKLAKREDMSVSAVIRLAIRNHLDVMSRWNPAESKEQPA